MYIPLAEISKSIFGYGEIESHYEAIVWLKRIPHTFMALIAGIGLSISGLIMQTIFRNPLAGPFVLGVSSGASFGVAILLLGGLSIGIGIPVAASTGAMGTLLLISFFAKKINSSSSILIIGLMLSYFVSAFTSFLVSISTAEEVQSFSLWNLGDFSKVSLTEIAGLSLIVVSSVIYFLFRHKAYSIYLLGDTYAQSLGVSPIQLRTISVIVVGILAGTITAYCGPIAFVGISVPHLARSISKRSNHQSYIINSIFIGAIFMLLCDILCENPFLQQTLPINSITCLFGAPVVIWIMYKTATPK